MGSPTTSEVSIRRVSSFSSYHSLRTACASSSRVAPPVLRRDSSLSVTSLEFGDEETEHGMVLAPTTTTILSSDMNGTTRHFVLECLKSPRKSTGGALKYIHRRTRSLEWLKDIGDTVSAKIGEKLNYAFDGKDAVEIVNSAVAMMPKISVPSMRTVSHTVDEFTDRLQKLDMRKPTAIEMPDTEFQGCQWVFAGDMGQKAQRALLRQHICEQKHVMEGQRSLGWQMEMTQALANTYIRFRTTYTLKQLLEMNPLWLPVRGEEVEVWRLVLETDWVEVDSDLETDAGAGIALKTVHLETDFAMPAMKGWMSVKDYCRETWAAEGGEWEVVEA